MTQTPGSDGQLAEHWDAAYGAAGATAVSWFEPGAATSIELIERLAIPRTAAVIDIGGGASALVDGLVERGYTDISVLDVSKTALAEVRHRLAPDAPVSLLEGDFFAWRPERQYDLWHDRALFHFLVDEGRIGAYLRTLRSALRPDGHVIMATFAPDGPEYCSGLPVSRYSASAVAERLGSGFDLVETCRAEHVTPAGVVQPFTWVVARHIGGGG